MMSEKLCRRVRRMSVDALRRERELLLLLIRDAIAEKQARINALSTEIERRKRRAGRSAIRD